MRNLGLVLLSVALLVGCSSDGEKKITEKFDKDLNVRTDDKREFVGTKDDQVIIQKRVYMEEELWKLNAEVQNLENAIYGQSRRDPGGLWLGLKTCREKLADPRVGGSGVPEPVEKWDKITEREEEFQYKVDKRNNLVGYSEENLETRISRYKKHKRVLNEAYDRLKGDLDTCEGKYRTALISHGLNPDDTKAKGEWVEGPDGYKVWKMKKGSTSDPEELMRRKEAEVRKPRSESDN